MYDILIVDDETLAKVSLQTLIQENPDFNLAGSASNGQEALDLFEQRKTDVIITDLQMPVMNGITLISRLRERGFKGPILVLSNYSDFELVRGAMKAGAYDYLLKADVTAETVNDCLNKIKELLESDRSPDNGMSHETTAADQQRELFEYVLRQYFLYPDADITENMMPSSLTGLEFPAVLLQIVMPTGQLGSTGASQFVETVFTEVFEGVPCAFTIRINDREMTAVFSETALAGQNIDLSLRLTRLFRTIRAYSMQTPSIIYARGILSLEEIRESYQLCRQTVQSGLSKETPVFCLTAASDLLSTGISPAVKKEILQILHYVNKNYSEKISLEDLSEHVHLNKEYLCRLFKKETGKSLFQYINDFRIQKAAELLKSGNAVIKDLSNKVGFTNQYIFTKRFKEAHGCTPSEYVQNCKKEEKPRK